MIGVMVYIGPARMALASGPYGQQNGLCYTAQYANVIACGGFFSGCPGGCTIYSTVPANPSCNVCISSKYSTDYCTDPGGKPNILVTTTWELCGSGFLYCYCNGATASTGLPASSPCGAATGSAC